MVQLSKSCDEQFEIILRELANKYNLFKNEEENYFQGGIFGRLIDAPPDLIKEISKKWKANEPCIYQLKHTGESLIAIEKLSKHFRKSNSLNCLFNELIPVIEGIVYEYVNLDLDGFFNSLQDNNQKYNIHVETLERVADKRIKIFKKKFSSSVFRFPITVFNLNDELILSENIRLLPFELSELSENELSKYKYTRAFDSNYYLEISLKDKFSNGLALQLSEKARDATFNILKLLATRLSADAIPLLSSNERHHHIFDFYKYGKNINNLSNVTTLLFPICQHNAEPFWKRFYEDKANKNNLIDIALQIPQLLLIPNFNKQRVVDLLARSLTWYGDAVSENNSSFQIQKIVTSMETFINFGKEDTAKIFKERITNLNITQTGLNGDIEQKARLLYKARSNIVHGSSLDENLSFCVIGFCSETFLRAIYYFSFFGFNKTGFNKELPQFLDDLPKTLLLKKNN